MRLCSRLACRNGLHGQEIRPRCRKHPAGRIYSGLHLLEWRHIESLFLALGAQTIEGNGSRVRFVLNGVVATFHHPHPAKEAKEAKPYQVRDARIFLENAGVKS